VKCQVIVTWYFLVEFRVIFWCTIMDTAWDELAKRPSALSMEKLQVRTIDPHVLCILTWTPLPRKRNGHVANQVVWLLAAMGATWAVVCYCFEIWTLWCTVIVGLALRTSVAASDPYHEDLTCNIVSIFLPLLSQVFCT
jgi:hypothetical protein